MKSILALPILFMTLFEMNRARAMEITPAATGTVYCSDLHKADLLLKYGGATVSKMELAARVLALKATVHFDGKYEQY